MDRFSIKNTRLPDVKIIERSIVSDNRGQLDRLFCIEELEHAGWDGPISQINETRTKHTGTVRGFHFQLEPHSEVKLISCLKGRVFDVAIDLRRDSETFLQHISLELSEDNHRSILIPKGYAHGFQTLVDDVQMIYCHSNAYHPESEAGINYADPNIAVRWPLEPENLSQRDRDLPFVENAPVEIFG